MPVKVLNSQGGGSTVTIAAGIRFAVDNGARIINASLGGNIDSQVLKDAVQYAADHNVLVVASAGNTPDGKPNFPAAYDSVLAVGATGPVDTYTGFSSWGPDVDVTAPGVGIMSTGLVDGHNSYDKENGTSASAPFVSGVAALVLSVNPSLTAVQVKQIIEDSSDDLGPPGWDDHYGQGRLNAFSAVQMAQQGPPRPHTPTPVPANTALPTSTPPAVVASIQVTVRNSGGGALLSIQGANFGPGETVNLSLSAAGNTLPLGSAQTDAQGQFRADVAVPSSVPTGQVTITAVGATSSYSASTQASIVPTGNGGASAVRGTVRGGNVSNATVYLKPSTPGATGDVMTTKPDPQGTFTFSGLAAGMYSLAASAPAVLPAGPFSVEVDGTAASVKTLDITLSTSRPPAFDEVPAVNSTADLNFFPAVNHTLSGPFLKFWQSHGGLAIFGYPISEAFDEVSSTDGQIYRVQYFERNRFEYHPEFAGTNNEVLMGLLGVDSTRGRTFAPAATVQSDSTHAYFQQTQHTLSGPFLKYWQSTVDWPSLVTRSRKNWWKMATGCSTSSATASSITRSSRAPIMKCCWGYLAWKPLDATGGLTPPRTGSCSLPQKGRRNIQLSADTAQINLGY